MEPEVATWEDTEPIKQQFPAAPAWGQPGGFETGAGAAAPWNQREGSAALRLQM
jgi:hypothetical protein